jgi:hypothetical protein
MVVHGKREEVNISASIIYRRHPAGWTQDTPARKMQVEHRASLKTKVEPTMIGMQQHTASPSPPIEQQRKTSQRLAT